MMKQHLKLLLAAVLYYSGVERVLRALFPRRGVAIFMLHSVQDATALSRSAGFCMDLRTFERRIRFLRRYQCVRMGDVAEALAGRSLLPNDAVAITFDDGYADNFSNAFPILRRYSLPATVYLTTDYIGSDKWLPLNRLYDALARSQAARLTVPPPLRRAIGAPEFLPIGTSTERDAAIAYLRRQLKSCSTDEFERLIEVICSELLGEVGSGRGHEFDMLEWTQTKMMLGQVEFGSHTASHTILSRADEARQSAEIDRSTRAIEEHLNIEAIHFAFPNGHREDYDQCSIDLLRKHGYRTAVTTEVGTNDLLVDPYQLRRLGLDSPNCLIAFELLGLVAWLRRLFKKQCHSTQGRVLACGE